MGGMYDLPRYYEIAFSFRDIPSEVDVLEQLMARYSRIPVKSVLELASGNSPHMEEFLRRGYRYSGLDLSEQMLAYSQTKVPRGQLDRVSLISADMLDFTLDQQVDFAYTMLGSLYAQSTSDLLSHFRSVADALKTGGLYLLDWCVSFSPVTGLSDSWTMEADGVKVDVQFSTRVLNFIEQTYSERTEISVLDGSDRVVASDTAVKRAIHPQEFLVLMSHLGAFEFVGWWDNWNLSSPLTGDEAGVSRPITVVRRI